MRIIANTEYSKNCFIHNWIIWKFWLTGKFTKVKLTIEQVMKAQSGEQRYSSTLA
jgi:hypothetical protein